MTQQQQASTSALITLLVIAVWVLATVARPYTWWKVALVALSGGAYLVIVASPFAQKNFMLDPSNIALTAAALAFGAVGAAVVEALWWLHGSAGGAAPRLWHNQAA